MSKFNCREKELELRVAATAVIDPEKNVKIFTKHFLYNEIDMRV